MTIPVYSVRTWAPVPAKVVQWRQSTKRLRHVTTTVHRSRRSEVARTGRTLWVTDFGKSQVGLVWQWAQLEGDVIVMVDPMAVVTNLTLLDDEGIPLGLSARACCLNDAIYSVPWQEQVCGAH